MGSRKTPAERLLNQERCITASPIARVEHRTTLSTLFMSEYAQAQLQSLLTWTHTPQRFLHLYTPTLKHIDIVYFPLYQIVVYILRTDNDAHRHCLLSYIHIVFPLPLLNTYSN